MRAAARIYLAGLLSGELASNFAFWASYSASVIAPKALACCKSINCWPRVAVVCWLLGPVPMAMQPL